MNKKMAAIVVTTIGLAAAGVIALLMANAREQSAEPDREFSSTPASIESSANAALSTDVLAPGPISAPVSAPPSNIMVEIQGAVALPGNYSFPGDARVFDALQKAGGPLDNAEIRDINIAATLLDGSVLSIPYRQQHAGVALPGAADLNPPAYTRSGWAEIQTERSGARAASTPDGAPAPPAKVNLNTATQAELETLPGVGEKTAEKIMRFRETQPFTHVDDLRYVQGIGEKRMETIRPHVTVE